MNRPRAYSEGSSRAINTGRAGFFPNKRPSLISFSESSRTGRRVSDGGHVWWEDAVVYDCSSAHPLFRAALDAAPGSDERARFIFRNGPENELWM